MADADWGLGSCSLQSARAVGASTRGAWSRVSAAAAAADGAGAGAWELVCFRGQGWRHSPLLLLVLVGSGEYGVVSALCGG